jgi:hypothetical protein
MMACDMADGDFDGGWADLGGGVGKVDSSGLNPGQARLGLSVMKRRQDWVEHGSMVDEYDCGCACRLQNWTCRGVSTVVLDCDYGM